MRMAIIDCGTNTFNLLIKDTLNGAVVYNDKIPVKLGEGGINANTIVPAAFERGLAALETHLATIRAQQGDCTYVFATSAIRSADNGLAFVKAAAARGLKINVIDGQQEAELIYQGVKQVTQIGEDPILIMDIGGGSTEFILLRQRKVVFKASYKIGSARLLERFRPSDPISQEEREAVHQYLEVVLAPLIEVVGETWPRTLIGSSGSFDTLAQMCVQQFGTTHLEEESNYRFSMFEYMQVAEQMFSRNIEERLATPGMIPMRADNIVMACLQINFVMQRLGVKVLEQCSYALKEGVFYTLENKPVPWQKS